MAKKTAKPALTATQLAELARAALDNSVELLADARVLLDAERWPRAYALAVLAGEEFGKFYSCIVATGYGPDDLDAWDRFWKNFTSHRPKFTNWAGGYVDSMDWGPVGSGGDDEWLQAWNKRHDLADVGLKEKMSALYVDYEDGQVTMPRERITEEAARNIVEVVARVVRPASVVFAGDLSRLVSLAPKVQELVAALNRAKTDGDFEAAVGVFLDWLSSLKSAPTGSADSDGTDS